MRLDGVIVRLRDTRLYVDFVTSQVIREHSVKEDKYENIRHAGFISRISRQEIVLI